MSWTPLNPLLLETQIFPDNKPFFGPAYIHFYEGIHKNIFFGKLSISIETEDIDQRVFETLTHKQDILMPLNETDYWNEEIFKVNMVLVSMDAMSMQQNKMKIYLSCENIFSNTIDVDVQNYDNVKLKLKFVHFSSNVRPLMSLNIKLPDNRLKLQMINLVQMLVEEMVRKAFEAYTELWKLRTLILPSFQDFISYIFWFSHSLFWRNKI